MAGLTGADLLGDLVAAALIVAGAFAFAGLAATVGLRTLAVAATGALFARALAVTLFLEAIASSHFLIRTSKQRRLGKMERGRPSIDAVAHKPGSPNVAAADPG